MKILRRIKEKIKDKLKKLREKNRLKLKQKAVMPPAGKETVGESEVRVEQSKFYTPQPGHFPGPKASLQDLPAAYDEDKIILQIRDPWWIHAYWEVRPDTMEALKRQLKDDFYGGRLLLRVYDVSHITFNGDNAHSVFDVFVNEHANNWYIDTGGPGRSWCVDLGLLLSNGRFITIIRSNVVHTPLAGPSWITDEEWMIPEDMFARLYGMGVGFGSSPLKVKGLWQERLKREVTSGVPSSVSSPVKKIEERGFWLVVNTELIVYGATDPKAKVSVQEREIKLRPDGTFTLRFALPDGKQVIPVKAVSADKQEERTVTPVVTRETR